MKTAITFLTLALTLVSAPAFAVHDYHTEDCTGRLRGKELMTYRRHNDSSYVSISTMEASVLGNLVYDDVKADPTFGEIVLVSAAVEDRVQDHEFGHYHRTVTVKAASKNAKKKLGLNIGQRIRLKCASYDGGV